MLQSGKINLYTYPLCVSLWVACATDLGFAQVRKHVPGDEEIIMKKLILSAAIASMALNTAIAQTATPEMEKIKNIIVMIGDGMGPQQVGLLDSYVRYSKNPQIKQSAFQRLADEGIIGIARTEPHEGLVVDSAASSTQFSSGEMAGSEMIGVNYKGDATTSMLEIAQKKGKAVGLITDTRMTHATPATYAAHLKHRKYENEIAEEMLAHNVDVMLAGGLRHWIPKSANDKEGALHKQLSDMTRGNIRIKSKRKDEKNLLEMAKKQGYDLSFDKESLEKSQSNKILGLYSYSAMLDGITYNQTRNDPDRIQPTLTEMTNKALSVLEKDEDGFFLMVEGGQIDWAAHDNDAGSVLHEMIKFSDAINAVMDWMKGRDDTLLVVSADHETGGFGFAYSRNDLPEGKPLSGNIFNGDEFKPQWNFGDLNTLDKLYAQKKSYNNLFREFDALGKENKTPENLQKIVNANTGFPITLDEARRILETEKNNYRVKGHTYLDSKKFPRFEEREEFFVYGSELRKNLLAVVTGKYANIVWATDNHTSTPVYVFAYGPESAEKPFATIQHSTDWANKLINLMK
ncbi:MAG: alkaline phosphatase [Proteobacteria bacterium]|nr:MAG: alkaline phosphatase [Pseudomonadota bacterium]